jgi:hypothetical protein
VSARKSRLSVSTLPPQDALSAPTLLELLLRHGGREYVATLYFGAEAKGDYLLTARGGQIRAQGPSGTVSHLEAEGFAELFGRYHFAQVQASGVLTDLGPLFG